MQPRAGASRAADDAPLLEQLRRIGFLAPGALAQLEPVGDGNLNRVRRVRAADGRSAVIKHAPEFFERFPEFPLSGERIVFEWRYGQAVCALAPHVAGVLPAVLHFDAARRILVMEDLGDAPRQDAELLAGRLELGPLRALGEFLGAVHGASAAPEQRARLEPGFRNDAMRAMHGGQLLDLGRAPGPTAPDALAEQLAHATARPAVARRIEALRARYARRDCLVHGDVKCANVVLQPGRARLLDAEFAHFGDAAFDLGTLLGHVWLHLWVGAGARGHADAERALLDAYERAGGAGASLREPARRWAGLDIAGHAAGPMRLSIFRDADQARAALAHGLDLLAS
jgi:5-methylthioribose kinase